MSPPPPPPPASSSTEELAADLSAATISKKQLNKEARKAAKAAKAEKAEKKAEKFEAVEADPFAANYGYHEIQSKGISGRSWTDIGDLDEAAAGRSVLVRGFAERFRPVSNKMTFIVLRKKMSTVQCVLVANADAGVSTQMVRFATSLSRESVIDVEGVVSVPKEPLKSTTQQVSRLGQIVVFCHLRQFIVHGE
jgi:aspartyl-tRNA synthetase